MNLFFAELIIALLFFSVSGAVVLRVFAKADMKSIKSAERERVIILAQSFAEAYSQSGSADEAARLALGNGGFGENGELLLEDGRVNMRISETRAPTEAGELAELTMTFFSRDEEIYSLSCAAYIPAIPAGGDGDG